MKKKKKAEITFFSTSNRSKSKTRFKRIWSHLVKKPYDKMSSGLYILKANILTYEAERKTLLYRFILLSSLSKKFKN
jgi:hypothetical protein